MSDVLAQWTRQAERMQARKLDDAETRAPSDELRKGRIHPGMDARKRKRAIRCTVDSAACARRN